MPPYNCWVHDLFKKILLNHCSEFLESSDQCPEKTQSMLITQVLQQIADIAKENGDIPLLDNLEKVLYSLASCVHNAI